MNFINRFLHPTDVKIIRSVYLFIIFVNNEVNLYCEYCSYNIVVIPLSEINTVTNTII